MRRPFALGLALVFLLAPPRGARAEGPEPVWEDVEKAVKEALRSEDPAVRTRAFDLLAKSRDARAVDLVIRSVSFLEEEERRIRGEQEKIEKTYESLFTEKERADQWLESTPMSPKDLDRYNEAVRKIRRKMDKAQEILRSLENDVTRARAQVDAAVGVLTPVLWNLSAEDLTAALRTLDEQWLASKNPANPMRWLDALAGVERPTISDRIAALYTNASVTPDVRAAALQSLGVRRDVRAFALATEVLSSPSSPWDLSAAAIATLRALHETRCIEPLVEFLGRADLGRLREDATDALRSLTGETHGPYREPWKTWWEKVKTTFHVPPEPVAAPPRGDPEPGTTFYGIHTFSERLLFVLDVSGSMDKVPPGSQRPKIDVAREELLGAILSLDAGARFNVILFNHEVVPWQGRMVEATDAAKRRVKKWIEDQQPLGGTNIHDALEAAFRIAQRTTGTPDVDTVFFLSDGKPTNGKIQDPERILEAVRDWNRTARLRINCVGVGEADQSFLRALAGIGGGDFVRR